MLRRSTWCLALLATLAASCRKEPPPSRPKPPGRPAAPPRPRLPWESGGPLEEGQTFALRPAPGKSGREAIEAARTSGLLVVNLADDWAPFIFSEGEAGDKGRDGGAAPNDDDDDAGDARGGKASNFYRPTFIALANNRTTPDELFLDSKEGRRAVLAAAKVPPRKKGEPVSPEEKKALETARRLVRGERARSFLEVYGIPPTLSVLRSRLEADRARSACFDAVDRAALAAFDGTVTYLNRNRAMKEFQEAQSDAAWAQKLLAVDGGVASTDGGVPVDPKIAARIERHSKGQARVKAIRAVQARLECEGLLSEKSNYTPGMLDLQTNEALGAWEKKNDIFGWGFLGGETLEALQRPAQDLHLDTFKRILMERLADAAGLVEDGSVSTGKRPATYKDTAGKVHRVPDLIGDHLQALLTAMHIETIDDVRALLDALGPKGTAHFSVAIPALPLPPYYGPEMDLAAEIDRGDIWYDFPYDDKGKEIVQLRQHYPHFTLYVNWNKQKIPLARWRTTIGSWRSEMHADGKVYFKYKNSDVGPRIWKNIVAAPVWIPPDGTPAKDLLTKKVFDRNVGPVPVVNTDVMGPGFQSAYGLAMAIHVKVQPGGGLFDNQIRTHGSVDYTSIARRFSHGCHRLVNSRAVHLFDFVLQHRKFKRVGNMLLGHMKKKFTVEDKEYEYQLDTRGYYYELTPPVPVMVNEGRIMGKVQKPIQAYVRKPGVDYGPMEEESVGDAQTATVP